METTNLAVEQLKSNIKNLCVTIQQNDLRMLSNPNRKVLGFMPTKTGSIKNVLDDLLYFDNKLKNTCKNFDYKHSLILGILGHFSEINSLDDRFTYKVFGIKEGIV